MSFDKTTLKNIRDDINKALAAVGVKYGLQLEAGNCTYGDSNFTIKLNASRINSDGTVETQQVSDFKRYCGMYGLQASDLGKTFRSNGNTYVLSGLNPKATKMPILAHKLGNPDARYKFHMDAVRNITDSHKIPVPSAGPDAHINKSDLPPNILALLNK